MDAVLLARLQFAITIGFHFIFPPLSIGLAWFLVVVEFLGWRTGDEVWVRAGRFFGRLLGLTFAVGVATGIVMEFQFGANWSTYSRFVGDVFGAPLAAEGVFAFFLESGFIGLYLFGRGRVSQGVHWLSILMVAVGATLSAFWILVANSWQQTPAGFVVRNGRAELLDFADAVFNPSMWVRFCHTMNAALIAGAFFVAGVSAWLLLRERSTDVARRTLRIGVVAGFVLSVLAVFPTGHEHARQVARTQPEKFAALEGLYQGRSGAPLVLFGIPDDEGRSLRAALEIPGMLSWMTYYDADAEIAGLDDFPERDRPPVLLPFASFHAMVVLGLYFIGVTGLASLLLRRRKPGGQRWLLRLLVLSIPLPVLACECGWIAAEVGRQPWIVYRLLRTSDAASPTVSPAQILLSIVLFGLVYLALGALYVWLVVREVKHGPGPAAAKEGA
jgi:cytochrome d ubiquinol oxidase subunit I